MKKFPKRVDVVYLDGAVNGNVVAAGGSGYSQEQYPPKLLHNIKGIIFDFDGTLFDNALFPFYLIFANPLDVFRIWKERLVRKRFAGRDYTSSDKYFQAFFSEMEKVCSFFRRFISSKHAFVVIL